MEKTIKSNQSLINKGTDVCRTLRLGYEGHSSALLVEFIDLFTPYLHTKPINKQQELTNIIKVMLSAQTRNDKLFLADIIEYQLVPMLINENTQN